MAAEQQPPNRPPETLELRTCPDPVDGSKAFITRRITIDHCEKLQNEGFHACGGCVHASSETAASRRAAMDLVLNEAPVDESAMIQAKDDPFGLKMRSVRSWADLEEAYCLVHRAFREEGIPDGGPAKTRINPFSRLPDARTFMLYHEEKLIGVLTVLPDSPLGLPSDELYHAELKALRDSGRILCEVSGLAVEAQNKRIGRLARLLLFRAAYRYAIENFQATDICVLAPTHHGKYYSRLLMFERLGEDRIYGLGGEPCPAIGLRLDLVKAPEYYKEAYGSQKGSKNLYDFFVKREVRSLKTFFKKVKNTPAVGQVGGTGSTALLLSRRAVEDFGR